MLAGSIAADQRAQERQHLVIGQGFAIPVVLHPSLVQFGHALPAVVVVHPILQPSRLLQDLLVWQFIEQAVVKVVFANPVAQVDLLSVGQQVLTVGRLIEQVRAVLQQSEGAAGA